MAETSIGHEEVRPWAVTSLCLGKLRTADTTRSTQKQLWGLFPFIFPPQSPNSQMADLPLYSVNQGRDGIQKITPNTRMCVYVCVSLSGRICVFSLDSTDFNLEIFGYFFLFGIKEDTRWVRECFAANTFPVAGSVDHGVVSSGKWATINVRLIRMRRERELLGKWKPNFLSEIVPKKMGTRHGEADLKTTTQNCLFRSGSTGAAVDFTLPPPTQPVTNEKSQAER